MKVVALLILLAGYLPLCGPEAWRCTASRVDGNLVYTVTGDRTPCPYVWINGTDSIILATQNKMLDSVKANKTSLTFKDGINLPHVIYEQQPCLEQKGKGVQTSVDCKITSMTPPTSTSQPREDNHEPMRSDSWKAAPCLIGSIVIVSACYLFSLQTQDS